MKKNGIRFCGAVAYCVMISLSALVAEETVSNETLLKKMQALEEKVQVLEQEKRHREDGILDPGSPHPLKDGGLFKPKSEESLRVGAYGEQKFRNRDSGAGRRSGFDSSRVVLTPTYQFTDNIIFNSEIEFEHGGAAGATDGDNKQFEGGNIEIEQAYVDFKFNEHFNWRSLGVDLVPIGYFNLFHEPTNFYSVDRPEIYRELIPSTWFEGSTSIYGKIVDGLDYQFQISTGLEDNSNTQAAGVAAAGITGNNGIRGSRPSIGDFNQSNNDFGYTTRLSYQPPMISGLQGSSSLYVAPNIEADGAGTGDVTLELFDTEFRYRIPKTGFEFRGEFTRTFIQGSENLLANRDTNGTNNIGNGMWGASIEGAYHWNLNPKINNGWEIVPFYRYTKIDLQSGMARGTDPNSPTGQGDREFHTFGVAAFPIPRVVLKLDYRIEKDRTANGRQSDRIMTSVGYMF